MKKIKVAIIDDDVTMQMLHLENNVCISKINILSNQGIKFQNNTLTHGTICTEIIIIEKADLDVYCLCVKDNKANGNIDDVGKAFEICINLKVNIIHMSLGSTNVRDIEYFENYAKLFKIHGIIFVCAHTNNSLLTSYPASLDGVVGVRHSIKSVYNTPYIFELSSDRIQVGMNSNIYLKGERLIKTVPCNSFAAALFTNYILKNCTSERLTYEAIYELIHKNN